MLRVFIPFCLAACLCLSTAVLADDSPDVEQPVDQEQPVAPPPPSGPLLQPSDNAPIACDPTASRFRYVEVRGTGFDAWATQRLMANLVDAGGVPRIQWASVWVTPQGRLTLEVNLCADPFRARDALPVGTYTVAVGPADGVAITATNIAVSVPMEAPAEGEVMTDPTAQEQTGPAPAPTPTPFTVSLPSLASAPPPTPLPMPVLPQFAPTPTPIPRTGPGTSAQPLPLGAPGTLTDGWQIVVTGVTPDAWAGIHNAIQSALPPASDQRDYMVRVQATYLGQGTGVFTGMRLALANSPQTSYDQLRNGCGIIPDALPPNLLTSGGVVRGNVCFTVRASEIDSGLLLFDNQSRENDRVYFALR